MIYINHSVLLYVYILYKNLQVTTCFTHLVSTRKGSWLLTCFINPFRLVTHASLFQSASVISRQPQLYWKPHFQYYQRNSWGETESKLMEFQLGSLKNMETYKCNPWQKRMCHTYQLLSLWKTQGAKYRSPRHKAARCAPKPMTIKQRDFHGFWIGSTSCPETLLSWRSWRFGG